MSQPERVARLLIAVCIAYIWVVYLGTLARKEDLHKIIHRTDRCDLSLFQLGKRLLNYFLRNGQALPQFSPAILIMKSSGRRNRYFKTFEHKFEHLSPIVKANISS